jgi:hypothetical protein
MRLRRISIEYKAYYLCLPRARPATGWSMQSEAQRIQAAVADLGAIDADAARVAEAAASAWRAISAALRPVIGPGGVTALYQRSLFLTRSAHPCLADARDEVLRAGEFVALQSVLSQQTSAVAVAANGALLQTFSDLLTNLIGASLTERLLHSVTDNPSSGAAVQDHSP